MATLLGAPYKQIEAVAAGCILGAQSLEICQQCSFLWSQQGSLQCDGAFKDDLGKKNMSHGKREFIQAFISTKQTGADPEGLWPVVLTFSDNRRKWWKKNNTKYATLSLRSIYVHLGLSNDDFFLNRN